MLMYCDYLTVIFGQMFSKLNSRPGLAKGHTSLASNFPFINILKMLGCANNRDNLLLATLKYSTYLSRSSFQGF